MGKVLKYCNQCDEGFAERFAFCPVCGTTLQAYEMNPVAAAEAAPEQVIAAPAATAAFETLPAIHEPIAADGFETVPSVEEPIAAETFYEASEPETAEAEYQVGHIDEDDVEMSE
ncbi:MAG: hypothetical protein ACJ72Z_09130, partial [Pyrinomonadaceae bacterium]